MTLSNSEQRRTFFGHPRWSSEHGLPRHSSDGGRSHNLSNPDVFEAMDAHGRPIVLHGHTPRTKLRPIDTFKYIPVSVFPVAYAVHRLYRHYRPRRLPRFTPLTLLELYLAAATPVLVRCLTVPDTLDMVRDKDTLRIALAAKRFRNAMNMSRRMSGADLSLSLNRLDATLSHTATGRKLQEHLKWLHEGNLRSGSIMQRFVWWYRHPAWSDQVVWNGVALLLLQEYTEKPADGRRRYPKTAQWDWDRCITFITTLYVHDRIEEWREKARNAFAASIPATWLARLSGRRLLYLPMCGVQRLLLGTFLYADWASTAGLFQHISRIQDKKTFARLMTAVFGNVDNQLDDIPRPDLSPFDEWFE